MKAKSTPLKRAIAAARRTMGPQRYEVEGHQITCSVCEGDRFKSDDYVGLFGMHTLMCEECSHVEFFRKKPNSLERNS